MNNIFALVNVQNVDSTGFVTKQLDYEGRKTTIVASK